MGWGLSVSQKWGLEGRWRGVGGRTFVVRHADLYLPGIILDNERNGAASFTWSVAGG